MILADHVAASLDLPSYLTFLQSLFNIQDRLLATISLNAYIMQLEIVCSIFWLHSLIHLRTLSFPETEVLEPVLKESKRRVKVGMDRLCTILKATLEKPSETASSHTWILFGAGKALSKLPRGSRYLKVYVTEAEEEEEKRRRSAQICF
ncbi:hypothetical protein BT69DRAFT_513211 [Atractiella rhizophila]|nr:hypothetical protein BT69DRAFT_513211 [Atractiella rhizophila]